MHGLTEIAYISQVLNFAIFFLENLFAGSTFCEFLREVAKVAKYLKAVEIKILDLFFWTKKSYRNITNTKLSNNFFAKKDFFSYLFFFSRTFAIFSGVFFNFVFWVASGFLKINVAA